MNILTGRCSFRTGVGQPCRNGVNEIRADEPTLPRLIEQFDESYRKVNVGKWHLGYSNDKEGTLAPNFMGWDHFSGILEGFLRDYYSWTQIKDGKTSPSSTYATTQNIDDALQYIGSMNPADPYFAWIAFNAPHTPIHLPPQELHSYRQLSGSNNEISNDPLSYFEAMVEATDTEMGRMLGSFEDSNKDGIPDNTLVIAMGDNGTVNSRSYNFIPEPYQGEWEDDNL